MDDRMMTAVRTFAPGDIRTVKENIPRPEGRQVLCKVINAGICGTDYGIYKGELEDMVDFPVRPGHEWSGVVCEVGDDVVLYKPGDRVVGQTCIACGVCPDCRAGNRLNCADRQSVGTVHAWPGAMCEYELFYEGDLIPLPDEISFEQGALIEPAGNAMMGIVMGGVGFGSSVAIMGTGPIGVAAAAIARAYGASTVISVGRSDYKLELCKKMGATHTVNTNDEDAAQKILEYTGGRGVDVSLEISGSKQLLQACFKATKTGGDVEMIAFYDGKLDFDLNDFAFKLLTLRASGCGGWGYFDRVMELMRQERIDLTPMITHRCSLDEAAEQTANLKQDNAKKVKVMVCMEDER